MSQAIVEEVLRALNYPKVRKYMRPGLDPELWFEDIVVLSQLVAGEREVAGASKDPDDDKYVAAAIEGRARFMVAGDSDLLDLKEYNGIRIVNPRVFLDLLVAETLPNCLMTRELTTSRPDACASPPLNRRAQKRA